jgi:hypothetical protein
VSRLSRFQDYRFIGLRDTMRVYDCDLSEHFEELERRVADRDLVRGKLAQTFAPDTLDEARNRGFRPARVRVEQP